MLRRRIDADLRSLIRRRGQTRDANSRVSFVANVQPDEQRCDLFQNPRGFQFSTIQRADARNSSSQCSHDPARLRIVAAHNHIAIDRSVGVQHFRANILKSGNHRDPGRNQFGGLLCCRALPHASHVRRR